MAGLLGGAAAAVRGSKSIKEGTHEVSACSISLLMAKSEPAVMYMYALCRKAIKTGAQRGKVGKQKVHCITKLLYKPTSWDNNMLVTFYKLCRFCNALSSVY